MKCKKQWKRRKLRTIRMRIKGRRIIDGRKGSEGKKERKVRNLRKGGKGTEG